MTKKTNSGARFQNNSYQTDLKGDMDEEEDLCAVPPHIMRIMQVQPLQALLVLDYELIIVMKTAVAGKEEGGIVGASPLLPLLLHSAHHKDSIYIMTLGNWVQLSVQFVIPDIFLFSKPMRRRR